MAAALPTPTGTDWSGSSSLWPEPKPAGETVEGGHGQGRGEKMAKSVGNLVLVIDVGIEEGGAAARSVAAALGLS